MKRAARGFSDLPVKLTPIRATEGADTLPDYSCFGLRDKVAIVTGASQGIGRAIALGLAQAGAHVVLAKYPGPRMDEIREVQREIEALGRKARIVVADVNKVDDCRALVEQTVADFGRIDILVNNASWTGTGDAVDVTEEEYDKTFDATVKSVFFASQAAGKVMLAQGSGRIINIGSNFGEIAFKKRAIYAAAKAAVHHMAKALSLEWASRGVLVNTVAPCITETESRKNILERPGYKEWATEEMIPRGRWNQPEDLVGAVLFLSSDMADMIVGHTLMVDGGWTIH
jgi:2-deoxy-D-gluconate 3-dehydrogenase